jgi:nitrogen fixation protein FixH
MPLEEQSKHVLRKIDIDFPKMFVSDESSERSKELREVIEIQVRRILKNLKNQNAEDLGEKPTITAENGGITVLFPKMFSPQKLTGKVSLYRPSNKKLDFEVPLSLTNSTLLIPKKSLVGGRWDITIDWQYEGKSYTNKKDLYLN